MPLHYIDPNDEPRECPGVGRYDCVEGSVLFGDETCPNCHGTGRLGNPQAEPEIRTREFRTGDPMNRHLNGWYWAPPGDKYAAYEHGPYPTEAACLQAAREALK